MDLKPILLDLIYIRSDKQAIFEGGRMEHAVVVYLTHLLQQNFPWLTVEEQELGEGRSNLFVHDASPTDILFIAHMDTVEETGSWTKNVRGEVDGDNIYGRGSADMKGGLVAILEALRHAHETGKAGIAGLFYCDEEYEFLGMRRFLESYGTRLSPKLVVCPEPTQEQLRPGCRGIVEWSCVLESNGGHAARAHMGTSTFTALESGIAAVRAHLENTSDSFLGKPTLNIARVHCGTRLSDEKQDRVTFSEAANCLANYCEVVLEVRTVPGLSAASLLPIFTQAIEASGATVREIKVMHDIGSFATPTDQLRKVEEAQKAVMGEIMYEDPSKGGYSDAQMAAERWGCTTVVWGPKGSGMHGTDEHVELSSVERLAEAFKQLIDMR